MALSVRMAGGSIQIPCLGFDLVQRRDPGDRLLRDLTATGLVLVDELAPGVGPAAQFGDALGKQSL